jgi:DNA-binding XRE family transcriptional regulator
MGQLGERIEKWRLEQRLFRVDIGNMIRVSGTTIINWEKDRNRPTKKNIGRIGTVFRFRASKCITG